MPSHALCACMHSIIVIVNHVYAWSWYSLYTLTCSTWLCYTYSQASHDDAIVWFVAPSIYCYSYTIGVDAWCMGPCMQHTYSTCHSSISKYSCLWVHSLHVLHACMVVHMPGAPIDTIQCSAELHDYALTETLDPVLLIPVQA